MSEALTHDYAIQCLTRILYDMVAWYTLIQPIREVTEVKEHYSHQFKMSHLLYTSKNLPSASGWIKN